MFIDTHHLHNLTYKNKSQLEIDPEEFWIVDDIVKYIMNEKKRPDIGGLNFREYVYVALASNSQKLLDNTQLSMVEAFDCIGPEAREHMLKRWKQVRKFEFWLT